MYILGYKALFLRSKNYDISQCEDYRHKMRKKLIIELHLKSVHLILLFL